ncbi:Taurine dioxygenase [Gluconacetobacter diazotrophicus PA1 5]|uniref:Alpha-ketoglutarate-dependent taurine dioxygenase n=2 Tax=Gluconacetobacter diazotrophicus TaxID=33996 RepID=A9H456_GLUDA|nr:TauD/TfdA family dioxygenase [Gluconacetobacter diazotrophicus]ACI52649.1 Taurine dioxygenase [Gluconacetobacter diazotrophicus PA1 5]MBB2156402.1 TauD/TfdA family dioxygenase [Gluconacetobacter diazotrophicus]TWB06056.1 taurine dioxygenase [Gluconacetobacter diazotrophicus]CAP57402.1 Alpha-ketoglutarate-dependent taurine dioxygenase [Gluconacetobacter diazotrophicus PA1 5]
MSFHPQPSPARPTLTRLGGNIGAEIHGITLSPDLSEQDVAFVYKAMLEYKVIFFRQQSLDSAGQEQLGARFGTLVAHPTVASAKGTNHIFELKAQKGRAANTWHADMTFMATYPKASILRSVHTAPYGGATLWANTATAYQALPQPLQELADKLWAIHTNDDYDHTDLVVERDWDFIRWSANVFAARIFETRHPLVRVHPETGEKSLILGNFVKRLVDFNLPDSRALLDLFLSYVTRPENTITWHWQPGDVAMWDNRAALHRAIADFGDHPRELQRVTLVGDTPVSVDGRKSEQIIDGQPNPRLLLETPYHWTARAEA